jgi:hypothetical protein|tara:strand:+ start:218 stop:388 length:171 start_codon:yes stop_codon:yes gene_type:complete
MTCAPISTTATFQITPLSAVARFAQAGTRGFAAEAADSRENEAESCVEMEYLCAPV